MKSRLRLGVLKEFYPIEVENLKRNENNQLIYCGENTEKSKFIKRLKSFIQPYNMLLKVRNQLDLATFISHFEMYHTDNNNGTIYIWTPVSELETFETLCNSINNNPSENSEHQLLTAMNAVKELLKCVCSLHKAELLHGDIKPSNFGFQKRGDEILVETIQMFDVDTICSVYEISEKISFSKGFDAPELYETGISNLTDIYAIGATLFNAVIVISETASDDFLYSPSFFDKLENLVNESELLNSCSDMIHPKFRGLLTEILKKSLCGTKERYQSCEEMLEDVTSAIYYITPFANSIAVRNTGSCKVVIKDIYGSRVIYDSLISELYKLMQPDYIKCEINPKDHVIKICYNNLSAYNVDCKKLNAKGYELIKFLHEKKYLINLSIERNTGTITFTYATPQIKELLTSEGKLLEVYVYHKAKETGKYNDIRSGFEINWENDVASNEFDCVLTKGLNSLFIECKATNNLRSDYYTKLYALADKFGINATVVLIADTLDNDNTGAINEKMRKTGEGFDIITLSDRADIDNIGEKLLGILKKRIE